MVAPGVRDEDCAVSTLCERQRNDESTDCLKGLDWLAAVSI